MSLIIQGKLNVDYINNRWLNSNQLTEKEIEITFNKLIKITRENFIHQ